MQGAPARFNRWILVVVLFLFLGFLGLLAYGKQFLSLSSLGLGFNVTGSTPKPPASTVRLPESLKPQPPRVPAPTGPPTTASLLPSEGEQAAPGRPPTTPLPPPGLGQTPRQTQPDTSRVPIATLVEDTQAQRTQQAPSQQGQQGQQTVQQGQDRQQNEKKKWSIPLTHAQEFAQRRQQQRTPQDQEDQARKEQAHQLIQPAKWAKPKYPTKTLYRSMVLPGKLLDNINSDIPASTIRIELPVPVFDKFRQDEIILDKGTIVVVKQHGKPEFGQRRLDIKVEQIEPPTGEVISFKGTVGDEHRAAGVPGRVNNHLLGTLAATGINAVLNLGLASATGTPSGFYQSPAQQAARDAGQSVARDINGIVDRQLKVPPTIERKLGDKLGDFVTISLEENVQFNRAPVLVR